MDLDRTTYLGGSDAPAVLGLSTRATPLDVWRIKTKRAVPAPKTPAQLRMQKRGHWMEPLVVDLVIDKLRERGHDVELVARNQRYTDPEHSFLKTEIDFELRLDGELINGDAKTVTGFARQKWGEEDTEQIPDDYAAQFMTGLMVAPGQRRRCLCAAQIGLDDVAIYWLHRDDETISYMRPQLVDFWTEHVLADVPPPVTQMNDVRALYPRDNGRTVEASDAVAAKVAEMRDLDRQLAKLKEQREALQLDIAEYIGEYQRLTVRGREVASFKHHIDRRIDEAALRRQHPDLAALFERGKPVRVLRMKAR